MPGRQIELVAVDEEVLAALVHAATTDAAADDVTAPITDGPDWTPERIAWLQAYHRSRRAGLDGPTGEATWAIVVDGVVSGQVRLKRLLVADEGEIGLWVRSSVRRRGVGSEVIRRVVEQAVSAGFRVLHADTTPANRGSQAVLERNGFDLTTSGRHGVHGLLEVNPVR